MDSSSKAGGLAPGIVKILQAGSTDTMSWFLFEYPNHEYFHYRISQSWLSEAPPPEIIPSERTNTQFLLSFSVQQKLAKILLPPSSLVIELENSTNLQMSQPLKKKEKPIKDGSARQRQ